MKPIYIVGTKALYQGKLTDYAAETAIAEALAVGKRFGTWVDGGTLYIDEVEFYSDRNEAVEAGIRYRQLAIFRIDKVNGKRIANPEEILDWTKRNGGCTVDGYHILDCEGEVVNL